MVICSNENCKSKFKDRLANVDGEDHDLECPACRMDGGRNRDREAKTLACPNCDEFPLEEREVRSRAGSSFEGRICVTETGETLIHATEEDDNE